MGGGNEPSMSLAEGWAGQSCLPLHSHPLPAPSIFPMLQQDAIADTDKVENVVSDVINCWHVSLFCELLN